MRDYPDRYEWDFNGENLVLSGSSFDALNRYIKDGYLSSGFLCALVSNDLKGCYNNADSSNSRLIPAYVGYLYNVAPSSCWGSEKKVGSWIKAGGLRGVGAAAAKAAAKAVA